MCMNSNHMLKIFCVLDRPYSKQNPFMSPFFAYVSVSHNVPLKSLSESLKKYAEVLRSDFRQAALTSSYLAVLPDQRLKKTLQNHYDSTHKV